MTSFLITSHSGIAVVGILYLLLLAYVHNPTGGVGYLTGVVLIHSKSRNPTSKACLGNRRFLGGRLVSELQ